MATTGRLGAIYSQLGNVQLAADTAGRQLVLVVSLGQVPAHDLVVAAGVGLRQTRTVAALLAVSRPPSRDVPASMAVYVTSLHETPATMAVYITVFRVVPAALAAYTTAQRVVLCALAVAVPPTPGIAAPRRQSLMPHLLEAFTPLYDREPGAVTMLTMVPLPGSPGMPWRVSGSLFEVVALPDVAPAAPDPVARTGRPGRTDAIYESVPLQTGASPAQGTPAAGTGLPPFIRDLRRLTLGQLAAALAAAGYPAEAAPSFANLTATTLIDGQGDITTAGDLPGYTTLLWRILRAVALGGELLLDDLDLGVRQLDLRFAEGRWLDWWGELYAAPREPLEPDDAYRARIVWSVIRPRTNNTAIAALLAEVLALPVYVTDEIPVGVSRGNPGTPEPLDRTFAASQKTPGTYFPGYPPRFVVAVPRDTPVEIQAKAARLTGQLRAAGVGYRVAEFDAVAHPLELRAVLDEANGARYLDPQAALWANQAHDLAPLASLWAGLAHELVLGASLMIG